MKDGVMVMGNQKTIRVFWGNVIGCMYYVLFGFDVKFGLLFCFIDGIRGQLRQKGEEVW